MVQQWKTIRIFISSTFVDMHSERDHLSRDVYLRLKERCMKKHLHVQFVDLRWGISQNQAESGETIDILLDEIAKCDIFVSLLGERYGSTPNIIPERILQKNWVREYSSSSFTALEILHKLHSKSSAKAFFYFRDPSFIAKIPENEKQNYLPESPEAEQKLIALKKSIRNSGYKVMGDYPCDYDGKQIVDLEVFGNQVLEDLWEAISELYAEEEVEFDPITAEREMHDQFAHERAYLYVKRDKVEELDEYVQGDETKPFVITGEPGCGKSAFLADWYLENSESYEILAYFIGASPGSTDYRQLLRSMCEELKSRFSLQHDIPEGTEQLSDTLLSLLLEADRKCEKKIVLMIDALDQLEGNYGLGWLLNYRPVNIKLILSSLEGPYLDELKRFEVPVLELPVLGKDEQKKIIRTVLDEFKGYRCKLTEEQLDNLLEHPGTGTPLYLRVALEELRLFGDYAGLSNRICFLGTDVSEMLEQVLERLENEHGKELVEKIFTLINCSRYGLSELEILELLKRADEDKLPLLIWEKLRRSASFYLVQRGEYVGFFHKQLVESVERRYPDKNKRHRELALYFENSELSRKVDEYPYQLMLAEEHEKLKDALCNLELFNFAMRNEKQYPWAQYWNSIKNQYNYLKAYQLILKPKVEKEGESLEVAVLLATIARFFQLMGKYQESLPLYEYSLKIQEKIYGENNLHVATALNDFAVFLREMAEYNKALLLLERSLEIRENVLDKNHPDIIQSLVHLAGVFFYLGDYEKSLSLYTRSLEISKIVHGKDSPNTITLMNNLAELFNTMGQFKKALPLYEHALSIREVIFGKDTPEVAIVLSNLAGLLSAMGDKERALSLCKRSLSIKEKVFGKYHPEVAITLTTLATILGRCGKYDEALSMCERSLYIGELTFGEESPNIAVTLSDMARICQYMKEYEKALYFYERACEIKKKAFGNDNANVAKTVHNLASLFYEMGEYEKALPLFNQVLAIQENSCGKDSFMTAIPLQSLAVFFYEKRNYEKALHYYKRSYKIQKNILGKNNSQTILTLNQITSLFKEQIEFYLKLNLLGDALSWINKYEIFLREGKKNDNLSKCLQAQAVILTRLEQFEKAIVVLKQEELLIDSKKDEYQLGICKLTKAFSLTKLGRYEDAILIYDECEQISTNFEHKSFLFTSITKKIDLLLILGHIDESINNLHDYIIKYIEWNEFNEATKLFDLQYNICWQFRKMDDLAKNLTNQAIFCSKELNQHQKALSLINQGFDTAIEYGYKDLASKIEKVKRLIESRC